MRTIRTIAAAALLSALMAGFVGRAEAHGGRGGTYTATGPAAHMSAPALTYYGGFAQAPAAPGTAQAVATAPVRYTGTAYVQRQTLPQRGMVWRARGRRWARGW